MHSSNAIHCIAISVWIAKWSKAASCKLVLYIVGSNPTPDSSSAIYTFPYTMKQVWRKKKARIETMGSEWVFFIQEVRNKRAHICCVCHGLIKEPYTYCFAHILSKHMYPQYRYNPNNIALVDSIKCHEEVDRQTAWNKYEIQQAIDRWEALDFYQ